MIQPGSYLNNAISPGRTRLILSRKVGGDGVCIPAVGATVRICTTRSGHLALEVQAPRDVEILREEVAERQQKAA